MHKAHCDGLPPLAYLPSDVNAVAEMNGFFWSDRRRNLVEGWFPQMDQLEELMEHYPDAYYILNVRDVRMWIKSVDAHNDMRSRLTWGSFPNLDRGKGQVDEELVPWFEQHHRRVKELAQSRGCKLLIFDIAEHSELELSAFLGSRVAWNKHNETHKC